MIYKRRLLAEPLLRGAIADFTLVPAEFIWNYETGLKGQALDCKITYSATNIGVETELRALLGDYFEVFANLAYIDAEIDDDSENANLAGNRFRLLPELTVSTGISYNRPLTDNLSLTGSVVYSYRSHIYFEPATPPYFRARYQ